MFPIHATQEEIEGMTDGALSLNILFARDRQKCSIAQNKGWWDKEISALEAEKERRNGQKRNDR